jgi:ectoine hydroxylase-related dioxygenase (phytanoyl-CoA dioxygenase family)
MNSKREDLYKGNIGRYNFNGTGADGSFQDLRVSPVGGIVSLPGAAEQAIHADTPHLFEHIPNLPAHYINIFTPGVSFDESVGGTAFCHGSHNLEFTAKYYSSDDDDNSKVYPFLVRPRLTLGDVVLFDCRILHFGLANTSKAIERVVLYTNTTHAWFHDPKNWDDQKPIFEAYETQTSYGP